jgi:sensor domain CHASE-containing protein
MTSADAAPQVPWLRYALLAAVLSALWLAITLFSTSSTASADEPERADAQQPA